ncbi:MAG: winged helix-turn-helix domain-containing protein [Thermoproteota archaeon]|nr:winged helix-turn-helix domain-containing protein [Thermoproteota archaeon]
MQKPRLLIPSWVIESNCNIQSVFGLQQHHYDIEIQDQATGTAQGNHGSVQQLRYYAAGNDHGGNDPYSSYDNDLRNNDKKILSLLNEEMWSTYSFKALERKLNIHQQSLSRALKRLKDLDLIEKTPTGYKLTKKTRYLSNAELGDSQIRRGGEIEGVVEEQELYETGKTRKRFNQLVQISIPIRNNAEVIANQLVGKWFGNLRWFGLIKKGTGLTLQWVAIDKYSNNKLFQINIHIVSEYIVIESNAVSDKEKIEAMHYSNRIINEITKTLQNNLQQEYEIPDVFAVSKGNVSPPHVNNKIKHNSKNNN